MLVDANILLYPIDTARPSHERADRWLTAALNGTRRVATPLGVDGSVPSNRHQSARFAPSVEPHASLGIRRRLAPRSNDLGT